VDFQLQTERQHVKDYYSAYTFYQQKNAVHSKQTSIGEVWNKNVT